MCNDSWHIFDDLSDKIQPDRDPSQNSARAAKFIEPKKLQNKWKTNES